MSAVTASSKYLKADDLQGREVSVVISHVAEEQVGRESDSKFVLYFAGKKKGMVLNATNINTIRGAYGPCTTEAQQWRGRPVVLFSAMVTFGGQTMPGLRVKIPAQPQQPAPQFQGQAPQTYVAPPAPQQPAAPVEELPGDIMDEASEVF